MTVRALCTLMLLLTAACSSFAHAADQTDKKPKATKIDQTTPQKVAEAYIMAFGDKDWPTVFACRTAKSRAYLLAEAMFPAIYSAWGDETKEQSLVKLFQKYGWTNDAGFSKVKNRIGMFVEIHDWLERNRPKDVPPGILSRIAKAVGQSKFTDFQITGNQATATWRSTDFKGATVDVKAHFRRIGGKWYLDIGGDKKVTQPAKALDQSTPQKVGEAFVAAMKTEDWRTAFACLDSGSRTVLVRVLLFPASFLCSGDEQKLASLKKLGKKYGDPEFDDFQKIKDKAALFGDLVSWLRTNMPKRKPPAGDPLTPIRVFGSMRFTDFKVTGDKATAKPVHKKIRKEGKAFFRRIDGKWYLDFVASERNRLESR